MTSFLHTPFPSFPRRPSGWFSEEVVVVALLRFRTPLLPHAQLGGVPCALSSFTSPPIWWSVVMRLVRVSVIAYPSQPFAQFRTHTQWTTFDTSFRVLGWVGSACGPVPRSNHTPPATSGAPACGPAPRPAGVPLLPHSIELSQCVRDVSVSFGVAQAPSTPCGPRLAPTVSRPLPCSIVRWPVRRMGDWDCEERWKVARVGPLVPIFSYIACSQASPLAPQRQGIRWGFIILTLCRRQVLTSCCPDPGPLGAIYPCFQ